MGGRGEGDKAVCAGGLPPARSSVVYDAGSTIEWIALLTGLKPGLRAWIAAEQAAGLAAAARRRGFAVESVPWARDGDPAVIVYVARTPFAARALRDAEAPILPHGSPHTRPPSFDAHRRLGEALGYPPCCVEAFVARLVRGAEVLPDCAHAHEDHVAAVDAASRSQAFLPALNVFPLGAQHRGFLPYYPCRFDCVPSRDFAEHVHAAMQRTQPEVAARIDAVLALSVAVDRKGLRHALASAPADAVSLPFGVRA